MALSQAPLGQLPYMNLARYVPDRIDEPAWHKALSALMVNAAAGVGKDSVSNLMSRDYTQRAQEMGLVPASQKEPGIMGRLAGGPGVSQSEFADLLRDQKFQQQLDEQSNKDKITEGYDHDRTTEAARHNKAIEGVEDKRYSEEHDDRANRTATEGAARSEESKRKAAEDARMQKESDERMKLYQTEEEKNAAMTAKTKHDQDMVDKLINPPGRASAGPGNQDSTNPDATVSPTVPGSTGGGNPIMQWVNKQMFGYGGDEPTSMPVSNQPTGGPQTQNPAAGTSAGVPGQYGQRNIQGAEPFDQTPIDFSSLIKNQTQQGVGQAGALNMTGAPAHPMGMSGAGAGASGNTLPVAFDPKMLMAAYALARSKGQPQGLGGTPGTGGLPLGYG